MSYCQFDEEEHLLKVFEEIGHKYKLCDIGARLHGSNSRMLIQKFDYWALLVDKDKKHCEELTSLFNDEQKRETVWVYRSLVTPDNVNEFVKDSDFLNIDIDSNDWWVWAHVEAKPRVVCIEYNNRQEGLYVCRYDREMKKFNSGKRDENASEEAMKLLGRLKGYDYIGRTGVNMIFVDKDCACQYRI